VCGEQPDGVEGSGAAAIPLEDVMDGSAAAGDAEPIADAATAAMKVHGTTCFQNPRFGDVAVW